MNVASNIYIYTDKHTNKDIKYVRTLILFTCKVTRMIYIVDEIHMNCIIKKRKEI